MGFRMDDLEWDRNEAEREFIRCEHGSLECMGVENGEPVDPAWCCVECQVAGPDEVLPEPGDMQWLFVYGTLLTGCANAGMLPSVTTHPRVNAYTKGDLYYVSGSSGFPVMVPSADDDAWVHGQLLKLSFGHYAFRNVMDMEVLAGYDLRWGACTAKTVEGNDSQIMAVMFTWPWKERGAFIPSGNWRNRNHG